LSRAERTYDRTGLPLMRQLALAYPHDPKAVARDDEYLLGRDLLVAPVIQPGATERRLYLPRGRWYDFWRRKTILRGPGEVTVPAPLDRLPLFVRAGARIPLLRRATGSLYERRPAELRPRRVLVAKGAQLRVRPAS
jgi:alpha-glucosidase (family GH31 glycosyl hydrolase)